MNLLTDPWIPVVRQDGAIERIAPYQLTEPDNPILSVSAPRSDLSTSLTMFLVSVFQTAYTPDSYSEWGAYFRDPPSPEDLLLAFDGHEDAFNLNGDGARFLQDPTLKSDKKAVCTNIASLMAGSPGEQTVKQNKDIFFRHGTVENLCPCCAAAVLFTCQFSYGPCGAGHFGSPHKGRIVTLVEGKNLWETIWLNVLPEGEVKGGGDHPQRPYPWLTPKKYINQFSGERGWTPDKFPKFAACWPMPGRFFLNFEDARRGDEHLGCDLCGAQGDDIISQILRKNKGINYGVGWNMHWTPTYSKEAGSKSSVQPLAADFVPSITYRQWLGLIVQREWAIKKEVRKIIPARVVTDMFSVPEKIHKNGFKLWAFGYTVDKGKFLRWTEGRIPLTVGMTTTVRDRFFGMISTLVTSAKQATISLQMNLPSALGIRRDDRGSKSKISALIEEEFWPTTDPYFYEILPEVLQFAESGEDQFELVKNWHRHIARVARKIFDKRTGYDNANFDTISDPLRVIRSRRSLMGGLYGKSMKAILGIPEEEKEDDNSN